MSGRSPSYDGEGDDFTRISGIGKARDRRLHQAGVNSYADLAALDPEGIASLLAEAIAVRPEQISDEDWTGQAARLAEEAAEARTAPAASDGTDLHYQSFVVRILLDEPGGRIASTTVQHVGSGTERRWPGLDKPALLEFISAYLPPEMPAPVSAGEEAMSPEREPATGVARSLPMSGEVSLTLGKDPRVPHSDEPFTVSITLDLTDVEPPAESPVGFSALVLARPLGEAAPQVVSQGKGIIPADAPTITLHSSGLPAGTYRLEAMVELIELHGGSRDLVTSMEGSILVVSGPGLAKQGLVLEQGGEAVGFCFD